jgi:signal transduction histidine kinase
MALFVALSGVPLVALGWLGWRLLQQDRVLDVQRERDRLENAGGVLAREFERELEAWDSVARQSANGLIAEPPAGTALLIFDSNGNVQQRGVRLPYVSSVQSAPAAAPDVFAEGEAAEFRRADLAAAASAYSQLAKSPSIPIRATALMRLARIRRKQERYREALSAYQVLAGLGDIVVAGSPAALVVRRERMVLFQTLGARTEAAQEAEEIAAALREGRFNIDRATFDFYSEAARIGGAADTFASDGLALADALEALWPDVTSRPSGRADWSGPSGAFFALWHSAGSRRTAIVGSLDALAIRVRRVVPSRQRWSIENATGREIYGHVAPSENTLRKTLREMGLPWTIRIGAADAAADRTFASRRNLFAASLGLMVLVIAASSYFVFRAVNRELRVARLQSDFVAAVSHEFRTPLTAMCHLTELLEEGNLAASRVSQYHRALARESRRLHTMVESLLDFGRIESGRRTYDLAAVDAASFVADTVRDFCEQHAEAAARVRLTAPGSNGGPLMIRIDRSALAVALRNLLDNAIKYSPEVGRVLVSVRSEGAFVGISVDDEGAGLSKSECQEIFRKFTRGAAARTMNVKGTGIGLTLAAEIVRAHGGRLEVESEPGRGSRFTTFLPREALQS